MRSRRHRGHLLEVGNQASHGSLRLRDYQVQRLENGLRLICLPDPRLPVVSLTAIVDAGSICDPAGLEGMARLAMSLLRRGTRRRSADRIAQELDRLGGIFSTSATYDHAVLSAEFMSKDADAGLELVADLMIRPTFRAQEVTKLARRFSDGIRQAKDQPAQVIQHFYEAFLFAGHPYGRPAIGTEDSLLRIRHRDLTAFHRNYITPDRTVLAIAGDIDLPAVTERVAALVADWKPSALPRTNPPEPRPSAGRRVLLLDKPDEEQAYFRFGNVGVSLYHPQRPALDVVRTVVGGRFTSWLNTELRIRRGLTYGAGCAFSPRRVPGPFTVYSYSHAADVGQALALAQQQLRRLHNEGLDVESLRSAIAFLKGQLPPSLETIDQQAALIAELEFYGIGRQYVDTYFQRLDSLTIEETNRVARQAFPLEDLAIVLLGPVKEIADVASRNGQVEKRALGRSGFYEPESSQSQ